NQYKVSTKANHLAAKNLEDFITGLNNETIYKNLIDDSIFTHNKYKVKKGENDQQTIENNTKTLIEYLNKAKETKKGIDQNIAQSDIKNISWTIHDYLKNNYPSYISWSSNPHNFFTINDPNNIAWKYNISFEYSLNDETGTLFAKFTYQSTNNPDIKITKLMEVSGFKKFDVSKITYELNKFEGKNNDVIYSPKYLYDSLKKYDDFQKMLDDYHFYGSGHKPDKSKMILNDISYDNQGNFELKYLIEKEIPLASQFGDTNTKKIQTNIKTFKFSVLSKVKEEIEKIINKFDQNVDLSEIDVPNKIFPSDVKTNDKIDFKFKDFFNNDWLSVFEIKIKEIIPNDKDGYFICKYEINSKQFPELKKVFEAKSGSKNLYDKKQVKTNVKFKKDLWEELTNPNNTYEEFDQKRNSFFEEISSNPNSDIAIQNLKKLFELSLDKKFNDSRIKYVDGIFKLQTKMIIGKETNGDYKYEYVDVLNLNIESIKGKIKDSIYKYRHYTIMEKVFKDNDIISILNDPSFHE
ncbi:MAG: hypothetical protein ACFN2Y_01875, partial [Metamycoplasma salivarium]